MNAETGIVRIRNKEYHTVAKRVNDFRTEHGDKFGLVTEIVRSDDVVVMRALIIGREDNFVVATGTAEEKRNAGQINRTSALENCETSAIGRALAAFGIGGTEFASANEVENAIHQQEGHSQGNDQGAVSPPAPKHSRLKTELRGFVHELNGCGDGDELSAFLAMPESVRIVDETRKKLPHLWDGNDWPANVERPEEFEPLEDVINRRSRECAEVSAQYLHAG